ncbi:MAG: nicotinate phosphoribosyltransferase [Thermoprotei archaeon]|nr:MAG: nicotinate phosphoribosyltransferase [Thermoprotei archaeon]
MRKLYIASEDEILSGEVTDIYFIRTKEILKKYDLDKVKVRAEVHASLPKGYEWGVFTGLEEALKLFEGKEINVYALPEGTLFKPDEPLMIIEGPIGEFVELETSLLGILRHYTSVSTKAARIKRLSWNKTVLFFGLRAAHPAIGPMLDRATYIGGLDGVSGVLGAKLLGIKPMGTMPHTLIIVFEDPVKAWKAFDEVMPSDVPRIALTDTFYDERMESLMAAKALGSKLFGVRLDTPRSRRGNMKSIVQEVRWALDLAGYKHVKIFVSGGINEKEIVELRDLVDGFGVGTSIAFPPSVDISMDVVEKYDEKSGKWYPISKRGKLPGAKKLFRCRPGLNDYVLPWGSEAPVCRDGSRAEDLLVKYIEDGRLVRKLPTAKEIREYVLKQLSEVPEPKPI